MVRKKTSKKEKAVVNKPLAAKDKNPLKQETPAEKRRKRFKNKKNNSNIDFDTMRSDFRKFWLKKCKELKLSQALEEVIWRHLVAIGCNKKDKFEEGIKNFGY